MEAMWTRFLPHVGVIRDWLGAGRCSARSSRSTADHGQWFAEDAGFRLFAPELGGGALLDLGVYPVSFASMVLGTPSRIAVDQRPGVHRRRRADVDAVRLRQRRPGRAHLHAAGEEPDPRRDRRHRREDRGRRRLLRSRLRDAHPPRRRPGPRRVGPRGPRPAPPGRRGRPPAGRGRGREPVHAARRDASRSWRRWTRCSSRRRPGRMPERVGRRLGNAEDQDRHLVRPRDDGGGRVRPVRPGVPAGARRRQAAAGAAGAAARVPRGRGRAGPGGVRGQLPTSRSTTCSAWCTAGWSAPSPTRWRRWPCGPRSRRASATRRSTSTSATPAR